MRRKIIAVAVEAACLIIGAEWRVRQQRISKAI